MNFGPNANDALKQQRPTYLVAPNFTTRPFPVGPLDLGTLVEDIKDYYPINQGNIRVPIPVGQRYSDIKEDIKARVKTSSSGEASLLARVLDRSIGGDVSLKGKKSDEDTYQIQKLETVYFYPQYSYVRECMQLPDVRDHRQMSGFKAPVYLITGLKLVWGATVSTARGRSYEGTAEGSMAAPGGLLDVEVTSKAGLTAASEVSSLFGKPADFVLGIQVQKIYYKRKFLSTERALTAERVVKNAVLLDDDLGFEEDAEDDFILASLDATDLEGLVPWAGDLQSENWLLPSHVF